MATNWPNSTDTFTPKVNNVTIIDASHVNNLQDAVYANQVEIARTYRPDLKPTAPSAYDDEFEDGALDVKWTAINCASGTVDLLSTAAAADTYDATTYTGMMALQPGRDAGAGYEAEAAILRQTIAPAATCKIVAKIHHSGMVDSGGLTILFSGIMLSGATGFNDNNYLFVTSSILITPSGPSPTIYGEHNIGGAGAVQLYAASSNMTYLMITKTGNVFSAFAGDGHSWSALSDLAGPDNFSFTFGAGVMTRLTLFSYIAPVANEFNPIGVFDFVRYFANNTPLTNS